MIGPLVFSVWACEFSNVAETLVFACESTASCPRLFASALTPQNRATAATIAKICNIPRISKPPTK